MDEQSEADISSAGNSLTGLSQMATQESWQASKPKRRVFLRCVGSMVILGLLAAFLWPVAKAMREVHRTNQCRDNLRRIGLALHTYNAEWNCLPPAYLVGEDGRRMHSWRVLILPYLGEEALYHQYRFDEPWDSPSNLDVARQMPLVYRCPEDWQAGPCDTSYALTVGPGAFCEGPTSTAFEEIADSAYLIIAVVETSGLAIRWTQPRDLDTETMSYVINDTAVIAPRGNHYKGANFMFADGKVRFLVEPADVLDGISPEQIRDHIAGSGEKWRSF